jgi:hypothetical protein
MYKDQFTPAILGHVVIGNYTFYIPFLYEEILLVDFTDQILRGLY